MSGTMEEVHRDADGIAYALQNSVYMEGELRTVREMFCNLFIEREDFFDDVIAPALRMVTDKKRIVISVDEPQKKEKKPKRTVN